MIARTRLNVTLYAHCLSCYFSVRYISADYKPLYPINSPPASSWCRQDTKNRDDDVTPAILARFLSSGDRLI